LLNFGKGSAMIMADPTGSTPKMVQV